MLLTFFPIHWLRQRFWTCGLFCFDFVYLFGFCHFILVFICHSPYLGFINLFSKFAFCLLRLSFFPVAFFVYFQLIRHVFHLVLYLGYAGGFSFVTFVALLFSCHLHFNVTGCTLCLLATVLSQILISALRYRSRACSPAFASLPLGRNRFPGLQS